MSVLRIHQKCFSIFRRSPWFKWLQLVSTFHSSLYAPDVIILSSTSFAFSLNSSRNLILSLPTSNQGIRCISAVLTCSLSLFLSSKSLTMDLALWISLLAKPWPWKMKNICQTLCKSPRVQRSADLFSCVFVVTSLLFQYYFLIIECCCHSLLLWWWKRQNGVSLSQEIWDNRGCYDTKKNELN